MMMRIKYFMNKKIILTPVCLTVVALLVGAGLKWLDGKIAIKVENQSSLPLEKCVLKYNEGMIRDIGNIAKGKSWHFSFVPTVDSSIVIEFAKDSKQYYLNYGYTTRLARDSMTFTVKDDTLEVTTKSGAKNTISLQTLSLPPVTRRP